MKVLILCENTDGKGGWYTYTKDLETSLKAKGHKITICESNILDRPLPYLTNPLKALVAARNVQKIIRQTDPDVVHITVEPYALLMAFLSKAIGRKTVLTIHGSYGVRLLEHMSTRWLAKRALRNIHAFITVSKYTKSAVSTHLEKCAPNLKEHFLHNATVVHSGIAQQPKYIKGALRNIITVGGIKPRKGILESLDALATYKKMYGLEFHFTIIGNPNKETSYANDVQNRITALGLKDHVTIAGFVDDTQLSAFYKNADLYLMPAKTTANTFEGFGLVYLEANSYGVPCIGPNSSGAVEAIVDGKTGYIVDPNNSEQMAIAMYKILEAHSIDPNNCRAWAQEHSLDRMAKEVENVYNSISSSL